MSQTFSTTLFLTSLQQCQPSRHIQIHIFEIALWSYVNPPSDFNWNKKFQTVRRVCCIIESRGREAHTMCIMSYLHEPLISEERVTLNPLKCARETTRNWHWHASLFARESARVAIFAPATHSWPANQLSGKNWERAREPGKTWVDIFCSVYNWLLEIVKLIIASLADSHRLAAAQQIRILSSL